MKTEFTEGLNFINFRQINAIERLDNIVVHHVLESCKAITLSTQDSLLFEPDFIEFATLHKFFITDNLVVYLPDLELMYFDPDTGVGTLCFRLGHPVIIKGCHEDLKLIHSKLLELQGNR